MLKHSLCVLILLSGILSLMASEVATVPAPGTKRMAERLEQIARTADALRNPFLNRQRADLIRAGLSDVPDPTDRINFQQRLAYDLLNSGRSEEALAEYEKFERTTSREVPDYFQKIKREVRIRQALCYLRLGELENCLSNHTSDSCIFPIRDGGVHKAQRGSQGAVGVLTNLLNEFPNDLSAKWLLNIAFMTLGQYPDKVPAKWLIPPKTFESEYDLPRFRDVAGPAGLNIDALAGGAIMEDFDGDNLLDVMVSSMDLRGQLRFFRNSGDGTFEERTKEAGLMGEIGGLNLTLTDYNNDGHPDVLILRGGWMGAEGHHPKSLLRNNGDGTFADVTEEAGLLSFRPTQTATWFDYNNDGWLDLFVGNESTPGDANPCELFRNNGNGTFTECAVEAGVASVAFVKAVAGGDFNNDGRPDLYLSLRDKPNVLFRNDGPAASTDKQEKARWKFTDVSVSAGVTEPVFSFPAWFWDYDNDGWLDLFVTGYQITSVGDVAADYLGLPHSGERARLYRNNRDGTFKDVTRESRLYRVLHAMGSNFGDLDNDGWLDFYLGTGDPEPGTLIPNRMFRNAEGKFFQDVTTSGGFGHLQKGHGVAFGDIDNDGDQDVFEEMGGAYSGDNYRSVLYENPGNRNNWIKLKLEGLQSNRAAIGARIKVTAETPNGERLICRTVGTGGSFGCSPLRQEIGLGNATAIKSVRIDWPMTGKHRIFTNIAINQMVRIREGEPTTASVRLKSFKLASGTGGHDHEHNHH